jgi:hypothetical protein
MNHRSMLTTKSGWDWLSGVPEMGLSDDIRHGCAENSLRRTGLRAYPSKVIQEDSAPQAQ